MSDILEKLDAAIALCRKKILSASTKLEQAHADPYTDKRSLIYELSGLRTRLADLQLERRCQTPVGSDEGSRSGHVFSGSNY